MHSLNQGHSLCAGKLNIGRDISKKKLPDPCIQWNSKPRSLGIKLQMGTAIVIVFR